MLKTSKKKEPSAATQTIVAKGSLIYVSAALALLVALLPTALGFGYLMKVREPQLQQSQIVQAADSWAVQQATNIHHQIKALRTRIQAAAESPAAVKLITNTSVQELASAEKAMLTYFPDALGLKVIPVGEMGTAQFSDGDNGLRNHIELDLIRRAASGKDTEPEAFQYEERWLTAVAERVSHPQIRELRAVILVTIDNEKISQRLRSLDDNAGKFSLEQVFVTGSGSSHVDSIASAGIGEEQQFTRYANVPGTSWRVAFTPSEQLLRKLSINPLPLLAALALCLLAILGGLLILVILVRRGLKKEVDKILAVSDKKTPLNINVPELLPLASQLRRVTLRTLRQSGSTASEAPPLEDRFRANSELSNPMFQSTSMLDEEEPEELSAENTTTKALSSAQSTSHFPDHIFRAYDIRGNAKQELSDDIVSAIGGALAGMAADLNEQTLIVACDGRISSPHIKSTLIKALTECGRDIIDIGMVPTPLMYFATRHLDCHSGIMVTGSHNPAADNGLKIVLKQKTIAAGGIQDILSRAKAGQFPSGNGRVVKENVIPAYIEEVASDIAISVPLKVVIDAGNGATSFLGPDLFEEIGCEVVPLYCEIDGKFPNHSPDTSDENNLFDLVQKVIADEADFGVAFDGDGDRLAVVTASGKIVRSDELLMIFAEDVVSRNPGSDVVFDVKCSTRLTDVIARHGGRPVLWKTGHAFMKEKMAETGALLGGEFSGHMFFGERWYGFDDGMYAASRLAEILSAHDDTLDEILASFPTSVNTPEILIPVAEENKFPMIDAIIAAADFTEGKVITLDGIRVDFNEGWGLIRASNTTAALTARFEASTEENLESIKHQFRTLINLVDSELELNF